MRFGIYSRILTVNFLISTISLVTACSNISPVNDENPTIIKFGPKQPTGDTSISLKGRNGLIVFVPLEGPYYNDRAQAAAEILQEYDPSSFVRQSGLEKLDEEAKEFLLQHIETLYFSAIMDLDIAIKIARQTSGPPDENKIYNAFSKAKELAMIFKSRPISNNPITYISTPIGSATIRYMLSREFQKGDESWSSYMYGERLNLGYYRFQIMSDNGRCLHSERIRILHDPTKKVLNPVGGAQ